MLVTAHNTPTGVWIIYSGTVELSIGAGAAHAVVEVLRKGDIEGDLPLLLGCRPIYMARATTLCDTFHVTAAGFKSLLDERPTVMRCWLSNVASRLARSQTRVVGLLGRTLAERTARLLLREADGDQVRLPQRTLAAMLGVQRSSLNRVLREFERQGIVLIGYCKITIGAPGVLARIAEGVPAPPMSNSA